jgi:hypothetical protein
MSTRTFPLDRVHLERIRVAAAAAIAGHEVHFAAEEGDPTYLVWRERLRGSSARHVVMAGRASAMRAMLATVVAAFEQAKDALVEENRLSMARHCGAGHSAAGYSAAGQDKGSKKENS